LIINILSINITNEVKKYFLAAQIYNFYSYFGRDYYRRFFIKNPLTCWF